MKSSTKNFFQGKVVIRKWVKKEKRKKTGRQ